MVCLDPAFESAGQKAGVEIWRIENFQVVPLAKDKYGMFFNGDSYILLYTHETESGRFEWNIHFWLGKQTSQDESGTAAIKSVELDEQLGGVPVQYREVQEHESTLFLSYFKSGIRYLDGGVKSGFHHVDESNFQKKLLQVKGKRNVRVKQVKFGIESMNKGDCFILQAGMRDIYVWLGPESRRQERLKAVTAANNVRDQEHAGKAKIHIIDEYAEQSLRDKYFEEIGPGNENDVKGSDAGGDDAEFEKKVATVTLYRISDASGALKADVVGQKPLNQNLLDSKDAFLLDAGESGIFVWIGKQASKDERVKSVTMASSFIEQKKYPKWTPISRVTDGGETNMFKQFFTSWKESAEKKALGRIVSEKQMDAAHIPDPEFNVRSLHREKLRLLTKTRGRALCFMPDNGQGKCEIWRIENFELAPVDPNNYGFFFGGDSYVIRYTYEIKGILHYIIYFWQGNDSSQDEKASSALWAVKLDEELGGKPVQIRVVQGREPMHFLRIFKGHLIIFMGGHASGFKNIHDHDTYDVDGTRLFHIQGTCPTDVRAVQEPEVAGSLNSDDVFVLETPKTTYIWYGKGASDDEKMFAKNIISLVSPGRPLVEVQEESEPAEFWTSLGGKGDYKKCFEVPDNPLLAVRLFQCSDRTGKFKVEEISHFTQQDLDPDDVMILDSGEEVYVWVGDGATQDEKKKGMKLAEDYLRSDPTERCLENTIILQVWQGKEPEGFTSAFKDWDPEHWQTHQTMEKVKEETLKQNLSM